MSAKTNCTFDLVLRNVYCVYICGVGAHGLGAPSNRSLDRETSGRAERQNCMCWLVLVPLAEPVQGPPSCPSRGQCQFRAQTLSPASSLRAGHCSLCWCTSAYGFAHSLGAEPCVTVVRPHGRGWARGFLGKDMLPPLYAAARGVAYSEGRKAPALMPMRPSPNCTKDGLTRRRGSMPRHEVSWTSPYTHGCRGRDGAAGLSGGMWYEDHLSPWHVGGDN